MPESRKSNADRPLRARAAGAGLAAGVILLLAGVALTRGVSALAIVDTINWDRWQQAAELRPVRFGGLLDESAEARIDQCVVAGRWITATGLLLVAYFLGRAVAIRHAADRKRSRGVSAGLTAAFALFAAGMLAADPLAHMMPDAARGPLFSFISDSGLRGIAAAVVELIAFLGLLLALLAAGAPDVNRTGPEERESKFAGIAAVFAGAATFAALGAALFAAVVLDLLWPAAAAMVFAPAGVGGSWLVWMALRGRARPRIHERLFFLSATGAALTVAAAAICVLAIRLWAGPDYPGLPPRWVLAFAMCASSGWCMAISLAAISLTRTWTPPPTAEDLQRPSVAWLFTPLAVLAIVIAMTLAR
jgi:hypothetical protein